MQKREGYGSLRILEKGRKRICRGRKEEEKCNHGRRKKERRKESRGARVNWVE